jgi:hypothetical protein
MQNEVWGWLGLGALLLIIFFLVQKKKDRKEETSIVYPLRLQAAERMILFLERIRPERLFQRIGLTSSYLELQQRVLEEIRQELDHNVAQQLYIKAEVWDKILLAASLTSASLVHAINAHASEMETKTILVSVLQNLDPEINQKIDQALQAIKDEVQQNF